MSEPVRCSEWLATAGTRLRCVRPADHVGGHHYNNAISNSAPSEVAAPQKETSVHCYNCSRIPKPNEPLQWEYRPNRGMICNVCLEDEIMGGEKGV